MRSLIAIQNPEEAEDDVDEANEMSGLGAYRPLPLWPDDVAATIAQADYDAAVKAASASQVVTQSPEELVAVSRRAQFLASLRPGADYGLRSNERNAFFAKDSGLGLDLFGTITESIKKSAPQAFQGVKGSEIFGKVTLPSWVPKIAVPQELQKAGRAAVKVAKQAQADVEAKKRAEQAARDNGVAMQTQGFMGSPTTSNIPWLVAGGALILIGVVAMARRK